MLLPHRFRQVPTFGNGVIRAFADNTSEMKKMAARDFEDILQVVPTYTELFFTQFSDRLSSVFHTCIRRAVSH
jgi:hypothetical protein